MYLGGAECQNSTSALQSKERSAFARNLLEVVSCDLKFRFRELPSASVFSSVFEKNNQLHVHNIASIL